MSTDGKRHGKMANSHRTERKRRTYGVNLGRRRVALDKERRTLEASIAEGDLCSTSMTREVKRLAAVDVKLNKVYRLEAGRRKAA